MSIRALGLLALSLSLLLASSAGMAQHEHGIEPKLAGADCVVEHGEEHRGNNVESTPELEGAGSEHKHICLACHLSGKRSRLSGGIEATHSAMIEERLVRATSFLRADLRFSSSSLRGPPFA